MKEFHPLPIALECAVMLRIAEIKKFGDDCVDFEKIQKLREELLHKGDILLYGSKKEKGKAAELFNELVEAVSVLAFWPGGINIFGMHFEVTE
jgi:hypothetical protein